MRQKRRFRKVGFLLLGLAAAYVGLTVLFAFQYLRPVGLPSGPRPEYLEEVRISHQGYSIPTWATAGISSGERSGGVVFVLVHGYGGRRDEQLALAERLEAHGEVLIPAMAGQGPSEATQVGFSVAESEELISVAKWAKGQTGEETRVVLVGISLGGASCWTAAGKEPELFEAVITDSAFARMDWATADFMGTESPVRRLLSGPVVTLASRMSGVSPSEIRPMDWAAKYRGRGLIVRGAADPMFGMRHAEALAEATGFEVWSVEGAGHAEAAAVALDDYAARILEVSGLESPKG